LSCSFAFYGVGRDPCVVTLRLIYLIVRRLIGRMVLLARTECWTLVAGQGSVASGHRSLVALLISAARSSRACSGSTS
jgi:hypothetical protein